MAYEEGPKTFWGWVTYVTLGVPAIATVLPASVVAGAASVANGGTYDEGAKKVYNSADKVFEKAVEFSDRYSETITKAIISSVVGAVTTDVIHRHDHSR